MNLEIIMLLAAQAMKTVNGLIKAAEVLKGEPLTDEERATIYQAKHAEDERWASLGPD